MKSGKTVSRPTENAALSRWNKEGCHTKPTFLPGLSPSDRANILRSYQGNIAIEFPLDYIDMTLDWFTLRVLDGCIIKTAPPDALRCLIAKLNEDKVSFHLYTI